MNPFLIIVIAIIAIFVLKMLSSITRDATAMFGPVGGAIGVVLTVIAIAVFIWSPWEMDEYHVTPPKTLYFPSDGNSHEVTIYRWEENLNVKNGYMAEAYIIHHPRNNHEIEKIIGKALRTIKDRYPDLHWIWIWMFPTEERNSLEAAAKLEYKEGDAALTLPEHRKGN